MNSDPDRITWQTAAGFLALAMLISLLAVPLALWLGGAGRLIVVRLATALFCAAVLFRLIGIVRSRTGLDKPSARETMPQRIVVEEADPLLIRIVSEAHAGMARNKVPTALRDRLAGIIARRCGTPPSDLPSLPTQRLSWKDAEALLSKLEKTV
jgi:hypothetical protein